MTHYLLAVHGPAEMEEYGSYGSKEEMEEAFAATGAFNDKLRADGYWVFAGGLQSASTATVVDGQGETPVMTDGPYLETKEVIGGFWVIDAPDLDVALKLAAEGSKACRGKVEVRARPTEPVDDTTPPRARRVCWRGVSVGRASKRGGRAGGRGGGCCWGGGGERATTGARRGGCRGWSGCGGGVVARWRAGGFASGRGRPLVQRMTRRAPER